MLISPGPVIPLRLATMPGIERTRGGEWLRSAVAVLGAVVFVGDKLLTR